MFFETTCLSAQDTTTYITIAAGDRYEKSSGYQKYWGSNWRKEWTTKVKVPYLWLDKQNGGLKPYKAARGGNETKSLRLRSQEGKEWVLRSIDKSRKEVTPKAVEGTFVEMNIQDGVSMSHPYGALALAGMQEAAGINHTNPRLVYLPPQSALDTFNDRFANDLYLFEERPDEDWSESDHLGNSTKYVSTDHVIEKMLKSSHHRVDQYAFAKVRLFDMLVGDWDRHADNFRWAKFDDSLGHNIYEPVPRDRDQVFFTHDGKLNTFMIKYFGFSFMKNFGYNIQDIDDVPKQQEDLDRYFTNKLSEQDWIKAAESLQNELTDEVMEKSLRGMPPEIYMISGDEILEKLKVRKTQISRYAQEYYAFLARKVVITASNKPELIKVYKINPTQTKVEISILDKDTREAENFKVYERTFNRSETKKIILYGIGNEDKYELDAVANGTKLHINAGSDVDSIRVNAADNIIFTDNAGYYTYGDTKNLKIVRDKQNDSFNYLSQKTPTRFSFMPHAYFSSNELYKKALGVEVKTVLMHNKNNWAAEGRGFYSPIKWTNFFGEGNETDLLNRNRAFHRFRSMEWGGSLGAVRTVREHRLELSGSYLGTKLNDEVSGFASKNVNEDTLFATYNYLSLNGVYSYDNVNDDLLPTKGVQLFTAAGHHRNLTFKNNFQRYQLDLATFLPIAEKLSLATRVGLTHVSINATDANAAQLKQHAVIGGPETLRGFRSQRFWGSTGYYNQNELRLVTDWRNKILNASVGVFAFFDNGRVWMSGENSDRIHASYGGGLMIAPFYKILAVFSYGVSRESSLFQFTLRTALR